MPQPRRQVYQQILRHPLRFRWPLWTAGALALVYSICELAGLRAGTAALTGVSLPSIGELVAGGVYVLAHLAFVFVVPVLLVASGLVMGLRLLTTAWSRGGR